MITLLVITWEDEEAMVRQCENFINTEVLRDMMLMLNVIPFLSSADVCNQRVQQYNTSSCFHFILLCHWFHGERNMFSVESFAELLTPF